MGIDKGYAFLFGEEKKSGAFNGEDGSEGYIYSDGSGYYKGADGSDGYIYSDGSGYFKGADGSDGYKHSDGSGYFRGGAKNIDAYQYADGSGYYSDSKHSKVHYQPGEKPDIGSAEDADLQSSNDDSPSLAELAGSVLAAGFLSLLSRKDQQDEVDIDQYLLQQQKAAQKKIQQDERRAKQISLLQKGKIVLISVLSTFLIILIIVGVWHFSKLTPVGHNSASLIGLNYGQVILAFHDAGFTDIRVECTEDLTYDSINKENQVYQIIIGETDSFEAKDEFPYDTTITIKYHGVKLIPVPYSSRKIKGENYLEVIERFESAGFTNIQLVVKYDIILEWLIYDGDVESVTINGENMYDETSEYRPDSEIVITYHTLWKNMMTD